MFLWRTARKNTSRPSTGALLKQHAAVYDTLAPEYHSSRFGARAGHYDFEETQALVKDIVPPLLAGCSHNWLALDLACGTGKIAVAVAQVGGKVIALDAATGMLQQCSIRSKEAGVQGKLFLTKASVGNLPY